MNTWFFYISLFILGLIVGSFLNMLIYRLGQKESLWSKLRSYCVECRHILGVFDLIPLFSFAFSRGRCRYCRKKISWQYPIVELTTAILFVLAYLAIFNFPISIFNEFTGFDFQFLHLLKLLIFISILIIIFVYDWKHYLILDKVTVPSMIFAFLINLFLGVSWWKMLLAALLLGGFFLLQFVVSRGRWVGGGDTRLGVLMGLMLGWPQVLIALFLAYISGAAGGILLIAFGKKTMQSAVPFGTFLSFATIITLLYGEWILDWYLELLI